MLWLPDESTERPLLIVEDDTRAVVNILEDLTKDRSSMGRSEAGEILGRVTVVLLEAGQGTQLDVNEWLVDNPTLQVATPDPDARDIAQTLDLIAGGGAQLDSLHGELRELGDKVVAGVKYATYRSLVPRLILLDAEALRNPKSYRQELRRLIRPGGRILSDIKLETLAFARGDLYIRGLEEAARAARNRASAAVGQEQEVLLWVMSSRPELHFWLPGDLDDADIPREECIGRNGERVGWYGILWKGRHDIAGVVRAFLRKRFPYRLRARLSDARFVECFVHSQDRAPLQADLDVVLWLQEERTRLAGRAVVAEPTSAIRLGLLEKLASSYIKDANAFVTTEQLQQVLTGHEGGESVPTAVKAVRGWLRSASTDESMVENQPRIGYRLRHASVGLVLPTGL